MQNYFFLHSTIFLNYFFVGRKGQPGSGILILLDDNSQLTSIYELKRMRTIKETKQISDLKEHIQKKILFQEKCFRHFSLFFEDLRRTTNSLTADETVQDFVRACALDRWALILDSFDSKEMQRRSQEEILIFLEAKLNEVKVKSISANQLFRISSKSPARRVQLAKYLAMKKKPDFLLAKALLNQLIEEDEFWYPQACRVIKFCLKILFFVFDILA